MNVQVGKSILREPELGQPLQAPETAVGLQYWPQLDGLRAGAVITVLASHYAASVPFLFWHGELGVRLFFTLSGFLITRILVQARAQSRGIVPLSSLLARFYARRALRLLPLFYAVLAVALVSGFGSIRSTWPWHALYSSNLLFARTGTWEPGFAHFWSLAVEEQFYLIWPLFVLTIPPPRLRPTIVALIAIAPVYRVLGPIAGLNQMAVWTLPFASLDSLGIGALLALDTAPRAGRGTMPTWLSRLSLLSVVLVVPLMIVRVQQAGAPDTLAWLVIWSARDLGWSLVFGALVAQATAEKPGRFGRLLEYSPLVAVGRISYGIYVLHAFVPALLGPLFRAVEIEAPSGAATSFLCYTGVTVLLASVSWHWYEAPINGLRRRVPYVPGQP